jgi:hypothetical protein
MYPSLSGLSGVSRLSPPFLVLVYVAFFCLSLILSDFVESEQVDFLVLLVVQGTFASTLANKAIFDIGTKDAYSFALFQFIAILSYIFIGSAFAYLNQFAYDIAYFAYDTINHVLLLIDFYLLSKMWSQHHTQT